MAEKIVLKKVTIRLPEGLTDRLQELYPNLPYNAVIRLALAKLVRSKTAEAADHREEIVSDASLMATVDEALEKNKGA